MTDALLETWAQVARKAPGTWASFWAYNYNAHWYQKIDKSGAQPGAWVAITNQGAARFGLVQNGTLVKEPIAEAQMGRGKNDAVAAIERLLGESITE